MRILPYSKALYYIQSDKLISKATGITIRRYSFLTGLFHLIMGRASLMQEGASFFLVHREDWFYLMQKRIDKVPVDACVEYKSSNFSNAASLYNCFRVSWQMDWEHLEQGQRREVEAKILQLEDKTLPEYTRIEYLRLLGIRTLIETKNRTEILQKLARASDRESALVLTLYYGNCRKNWREALPYALIAAEGFLEAKQLLALHGYRLGMETLQTDPKEAFRFFQLASNASVSACYQLGLCYLFGRGVEVDLKEARSCLQRAANENFGPALYALSCFEIGEKRVDLLVNAAFQYYTPAAEECLRLNLPEETISKVFCRAVLNGE